LPKYSKRRVKEKKNNKKNNNYVTCRALGSAEKTAAKERRTQLGMTAAEEEDLRRQLRRMREQREREEEGERLS
jgi:hypothetical protein